MAVGVTIAALVAALRPGTEEKCIRLVGMWLQLFGVSTVIWGIAETRLQFGRPSVFSLATAWIRRFPPYRLQAITGYFHAPMPDFTVEAYGTVSAAPPANPTLEERLARLEGRELELREAIQLTNQRIEQRARQGEAALANESTARERVAQDILRRLEVTVTGGVHITAIGSIWLLVGVVLGTASPELAAFIK